MSETTKHHTWYTTPFGELVGRCEPPGKPRPSVAEAMRRLMAQRSSEQTAE
jgi:hypothetical protein